MRDLRESEDDVEEVALEVHLDEIEVNLYVTVVYVWACYNMLGSQRWNGILVSSNRPMELYSGNLRRRTCARFDRRRQRFEYRRKQRFGG
jgi:hypothetical protein